MKSPFPPLDQQNCASCRYRVEGQCRRHSPASQVVSDVQPESRGPKLFLAVWPIVDTVDWCGDWAPKDADERLALTA